MSTLGVADIVGIRMYYDGRSWAKLFWWQTFIFGSKSVPLNDKTIFSAFYRLFFFYIITLGTRVSLYRVVTFGQHPGLLLLLLFFSFISYSRREPAKTIFFFFLWRPKGGRGEGCFRGAAI